MAYFGRCSNTVAERKRSSESGREYELAVIPPISPIYARLSTSVCWCTTYSLIYLDGVKMRDYWIDPYYNDTGYATCSLISTINKREGWGQGSSSKRKEGRHYMYLWARAPRTFAEINETCHSQSHHGARESLRGRTSACLDCLPSCHFAPISALPS